MCVQAQILSQTFSLAIPANICGGRQGYPVQQTCAPMGRGVSRCKPCTRQARLKEDQRTQPKPQWRRSQDTIEQPLAHQLANRRLGAPERSS